MKRHILSITIICALLCTFTACGTDEEPETVSKAASVSSSEADVTSEAEHEETSEPAEEEAAEETEPEESTAPEEAEEDTQEETSDAAPEADSDAPTLQEAKDIISSLNTIDLIGAGALDFDAEAEYTADNGDIYHKVTDARFSTSADVRALMDNVLTQSLINDRYYSILDADDPMCIDVDGELYIKSFARGGGFAFTDDDPVIEKTSADGWSILAMYDNYGTIECMDIGVINDGGWKVYNIAFGA